MIKRLIFIVLIIPLPFLAQPGGEDCSSATVIPSIPFTGIGNTSSATDNYFENCPDVGNLGGAPDHVYVYNNGPNTQIVDVSLCENLTNFDSQLIIYENNCFTTPIGCQEDGCQSPDYNAPYNSQLTAISLQPNTNYYFVVDGYQASSYGNYQINIEISNALILPDSSNLPLIFINTLGQTIEDEPKISATMGIIDNGIGQQNFLTDSLNAYNGEIGIEIRGSSSAMFPKKGYGLETRDGSGNNNNVALFNMPSENDWVLHAPYSDKSLMRNFLAYYFGQRMYYYSPRTKFCELIINNQYKGVYLFTEKIKRDKGRVNISKLDFDDLYADSLTGGYIIKVDKFTGANNDSWTSAYQSISSNPQPIEFLYHYPEADDIHQLQKNYIAAYLNSFEDALDGPNFSDTTLGYRAYADINSFVDYLLLTEATKNVDGYRISTYLYKNKTSKGGKLHVGPPWDYNLGWGNADYCEGGLTNGWVYEFNDVCSSGGYQVPFWWGKLMTDPEFLNRINCRWNELRQGPFHSDSINQLIDQKAIYLNSSAERNFIRWDILSTYIWPNNYVGNTYSNELNYLKTWINSRLIWMDNNLPGSPIDCTFLSENTIENPFKSKAFPNPFNSNFYIEINGLKTNSNIKIKLYNLNGQCLFDNQFSCSNQLLINSSNYPPLKELSKGIYFIQLNVDGNLQTVKIIKQ